MDSKETKETKKAKKRFSPMLAFPLYVALCALGILVYRHFIRQVPVFEHSTEELIHRGVILSLYLVFANLPALWIPYMKHSVINFGAHFVLVCIFMSLGLACIVSLSPQLFMIPYFVIWQSFVVIKGFAYRCPTFFSFLTASLKFLLGCCVGILFFAYCAWLQLIIFERYDFSGSNYGIPFERRALFSDLGF